MTHSCFGKNLPPHFPSCACVSWPPLAPQLPQTFRACVCGKDSWLSSVFCPTDHGHWFRKNQGSRLIQQHTIWNSCWQYWEGDIFFLPGYKLVVSGGHHMTTWGPALLSVLAWEKSYKGHEKERWLERDHVLMVMFLPLPEAKVTPWLVSVPEPFCYGFLELVVTERVLSNKHTYRLKGI